MLGASTHVWHLQAPRGSCESADVLSIFFCRGLVACVRLGQSVFSQGVSAIAGSVVVYSLSYRGLHRAGPMYSAGRLRDRQCALTPRGYFSLSRAGARLACHLTSHCGKRSTAVRSVALMGRLRLLMHHGRSLLCRRHSSGTGQYVGVVCGDSSLLRHPTPAAYELNVEDLPSISNQQH